MNVTSKTFVQLKQEVKRKIRVKGLDYKIKHFVREIYCKRDKEVVGH